VEYMPLDTPDASEPSDATSDDAPHDAAGE
jgi:hypothetical protein